MHQRKVLNDDEFFSQKSDLKLILLGDSAVGKSKYKILNKNYRILERFLLDN